MLYVLVVILFSGQAVVVEYGGLDAEICRAAAEQLVDSGKAAVARCFERADA